MVPLSSLALPILGSAVVVFVVSSIVHMVLQYHKNDFKKVPDEDATLDALRRLDIPPGDYVAPHAGGPEGMKKREFIEKAKKGPIVVMTLAPGGPVSMGSSLVQWFLFSVLVSLFAAYIASRTLEPGTSYLSVFRVVGTASFMAYSFGYIPNSIWYKKAWSTTLKIVFDGLVYALFTAAVLGWLWPR